MIGTLRDKIHKIFQKFSLCLALLLFPLKAEFCSHMLNSVHKASLYLAIFPYKVKSPKSCLRGDENELQRLKQSKDNRVVSADRDREPWSDLVAFLGKACLDTSADRWIFRRAFITALLFKWGKNFW